MRLTKLLAAAALLAGVAAADDIMKFKVAGKNPDGSGYEGTATIEELPSQGVGKGDRFKVTWNPDSDPVVGIGVVSSENRKVLAVAFTYDGRAGIALLTENSGSASGVWAMEGGPGLGTEVWTPVGAP